MSKYRIFIFSLGVLVSATASTAALAQTAAEQVKAGYDQAQTGSSAYTFDLISITDGVINSTQSCQDTFEAVSTAVSLQPQQAPAIISSLSLKRDCNCTGGGLWAEQELNDWLSSEDRYTSIRVDTAYSCSQVTVRAGISGLPQNEAFETATTAAQKQQIINQMSQQVHDILFETFTLQSKNGWECDAVDVNIAAAMQGVLGDELKEAVYAELAHLFAADTDDAAVLACSAVAFQFVSEFPSSPLIVQGMQGKRGVALEDLASPN